LLGDPGKDSGLAVRRLLEADGDQCLVVFDNAADADVLRPYLPAGGKARILITSNRQSMAELGKPVEVEVLTLVRQARSWRSGPDWPMGLEPANWRGNWVSCRWDWHRRWQ
jgi:hypothetical protein